MMFDEHTDGDYRIYVGALDAPREAYRDDSLACGHRWPTPREALAYALHKARAVIHREQHRLAC